MNRRSFLTRLGRLAATVPFLSGFSAQEEIPMPDPLPAAPEKPGRIHSTNVMIYVGGNELGRCRWMDYTIEGTFTWQTASDSREQKPAGQFWQCGKCGRLNKMERTDCVSCGFLRRPGDD